MRARRWRAFHALTQERDATLTKERFAAQVNARHARPRPDFYW
jgi:hypothetical protein